MSQHRRRLHVAALACYSLAASCATREDDDPRFVRPPDSLPDYGNVSNIGSDGGGDSAVVPAPDATLDAAPMPAGPVVLPGETITVATYNVENLFDMVDDAERDEQEYTPGNTWTQAKLDLRLASLGAMFALIDAEIVAVNEVEGTRSLASLRDAIRDAGGPDYGFLAESRGSDPRGIEIGVLSRFPIVKSLDRAIAIAHDCEGEDGPTTLDYPEARPILQVEIDTAGDGVPDLVFLANHWKARGRDSWPCESEEHRRRSARQLLQLVTSLRQNPELAVIALGDFNAYEFEAPLHDIVGARVVPGGEMYNAWGDTGVAEQANQNGNDASNSSYRFDDVWSRLDHILLSPNMIGEVGRWAFVGGSAETIRPAFALDSSGGPDDYDVNSGTGLSDHLPFRIALVVR